jgi:glutamyl-Q tRNA(Asp) synthetase
VGETTPILRFAPSPNGRLHLGHAYSALLNTAWAERLGGLCRLRIEDIDPVRSTSAFVRAIIDDLAWLGLRYPEPIRLQSRHMSEYRSKLTGLAARGLAYPCFCSRSTIRAAVEAKGGQVPRDPDGAPLYPGTCRHLDPPVAAARVDRGEPHTWRLAMGRALMSRTLPADALSFIAFDGAGERCVPAEPGRWGDAVIARRDVPTSYHLSVVHDDAVEGVTHVVRGRDLEAATGLHVLLQHLLGLPTPRYHHHGLIEDDEGRKLAKSRGATSLAELRDAGLTPAEVRAMVGL